MDLGNYHNCSTLECPFFEKIIEFINIIFCRIFRKMALNFSKNLRNAILLQIILFKEI
jgi:hypothetical protein